MIQTILTHESLAQRADHAEYVLLPEVILLIVGDGSARLLNMDGYFCAIPAVGAVMLQEVLTQGVAPAVHLIAARFGIDTKRVHRDLEIFLNDLERWRFLRRRGTAWRGHPSRVPLTCGLFAPALSLVTRCVHKPRTKSYALLTLAWLSFRLFGWTQTLTAWRRSFPDHASSASLPQREAAARTISEVVRATASYHPLGMGCKERALICWALCRTAGVPAALVLGISLYPLTSHCWCESGAFVLSDDRDRCARFTPLRRYEA